MKLLARIRLACRVLVATHTGQWRRLTEACNAERARCGNESLLAALQEERTLHTERQQVVAGVRTTRQAARLLAEARHLVAQKR